MSTIKGISNERTTAEGRFTAEVSNPRHFPINTVAAQDVKRRGVRAILEKLPEAPVHVLRHNRPVFVALREEHYRELVEEIEDARLRASLADAEAGRVRFASPRELMDEITGQVDVADRTD